jgi:branched-chain amino acid transport system permease protein
MANIFYFRARRFFEIAATMENTETARIGLAAVLGLVAAGGNLLGGYFVVRREWPRKYLQYFLALGAGYIGDVTNLCGLPWLTDTLQQECISKDGQVSLFGSNYQDVFAFFVLILVLIFRPSGLLGERVADRA